jgi:hypothetical protein
LGAHGAESKTILLIFVLHAVGLDELEDDLDKDEEEELSSSSLSIAIVSLSLSKCSSIVSKS